MMMMVSISVACDFIDLKAQCAETDFFIQTKMTPNRESWQDVEKVHEAQQV